MAISIFAWLLYPISLLYRAIVVLRKFLYQNKIFTVNQFPVPVIVVGNITLGGTGKTPLVIWLANFLKSRGYHPGIVSRGYKAKTKNFPQIVSPSMDPKRAGDEPLLLAQRTQSPIVIDPNRSRAVKHLLNNFACDVVISDDGLQHYAMHRDIEIIVIDGIRLFDNGFCLPAGKLREPISRVAQADLLVSTHKPYLHAYVMRYHITNICNLRDESLVLTPQVFRHRQVHAVAGIGNPDQFFELLEQYLNISVIKHAFPDHHFFKPQDFSKFSQEIIIMTEKDAVKCKNFSQENFYFVKIDAQIDDAFAEAVLVKLKSSLVFV